MAQMQVLARRVLTFLRSFYACSQKYKKVWHFLRKTLDICLRFGYNNTRRQGHGPRRKEYADVAELADALDSGSSSLKRVWVQIPSSAPKSSNVCSGIFCFSDLFGMTSIVPRTVGADSISARARSRRRRPPRAHIECAPTNALPCRGRACPALCPAVIAILPLYH